MLVGLGVALGRAGRSRTLGTREQNGERDLGLAAAEPTGEGLRRMALEQIELALSCLPAEATPSEHAVHETRKAIKRLRALLRLLRADLGKATFKRENAALRDIAARLSGARDAEVMLGTLDALIERHPGKLRGRAGVRRLRRTLASERDRATRKTLAKRATIAQVRGDLLAFRARVELWPLKDVREGRLVAEGMSSIYAQGRERHERALRSAGRNTQAMHDWRKRVKSLRYAAEMLERQGEQQAKRAKRLGAMAARADDLGETLGEEHDLALLAQRVRAERRRSSRKGRGIDGKSAKRLLRLIARRRRKLRKAALGDGERLYRRSPKRLRVRLS